MSLKIRTPVDVGFLIGAVALVLVGVVSYRFARGIQVDNERISHTYEVLYHVGRLGYGLADDDHSPSEIANIAAELDAIRRLTTDNLAQQARVDSMQTAPSRNDSLRLAANMQVVEIRLLSSRRGHASQSALRSNIIIIFSTILALLLMAIALALLHADLDRRRAAESALRESELRQRRFVEQAADAIFLVDPSAACIEGNARAAEMLGRAREAIPGLALRHFIRGDRKGDDANAAAVLPMLRYGHVTTGDFRILRPDGSTLPVEIRAAMLDDGNVQIIARDVSERKEVDRMKDEFLSVVSHELRTPLTSIRGALGLLGAGQLDEDPVKRRRLITLAEESSERLIRLINDILDTERLVSGTVSLDLQRCAAAQIVQNAVDALRPLAEQTGVELRCGSEAETYVWADPDRLTQTLMNLVGNAIKFSPAGGAVDVRVVPKGEEALFTVRDHGRGIPPEMINRIFDRFQQVDTSDSRDKGGTGLGLAISRGIVEQHRGRLWVESTPGDGATFLFTIPLARENV